jgi:hypothetical protein
MATYVICETHGTDYWRGDRWTPADDEAREFASLEEAEAEAEARCASRSWRIVARDE